MKKGSNLRWSLIQCSGGDEGDRTPDLLTASQALSQLSYAPVRKVLYGNSPGDARTILENILRCVERRRAEETHDARNSPRGAPRGQRQARRPPSRGSACRPRCHRSEQSNPRCFRGRVSSEPLSEPSGQFTEPCVARASWSLHKRTGLLRRFPDFRPHACFRKTGR